MTPPQDSASSSFPSRHSGASGSGAPSREPMHPTPTGSQARGPALTPHPHNSNDFHDPLPFHAESQNLGPPIAHSPLRVDASSPVTSNIYNTYSGPGGSLHSSFTPSPFGSFPPQQTSVLRVTPPSHHQQSTASIAAARPAVGFVWPGLPRAPSTPLTSYQFAHTKITTPGNAIAEVANPASQFAGATLPSSNLSQDLAPSHTPLHYPHPGSPALGARAHRRGAERRIIESFITPLINPVLQHERLTQAPSLQLEMGIPSSNPRNILQVPPLSRPTNHTPHSGNPPPPPPSPTNPSRRPLPPQYDSEPHRVKKSRLSRPDPSPGPPGGSRVEPLAETRASRLEPDTTPSPDSQPQGLNNGVGKVKTNDGCFKCRERHKKCSGKQDERGWCSNCVKLGHECPGGYGLPKPRATKSPSTVKRKCHRRSQRVTQSTRRNKTTAVQTTPSGTVVPSNTLSRSSWPQPPTQQVSSPASQPLVPPIAVTAPSPTARPACLIAHEGFETSSLSAPSLRPSTPGSTASGLSTVFTASPALSGTSPAFYPSSPPSSPNPLFEEESADASGLGTYVQRDADEIAEPSFISPQFLSWDWLVSAGLENVPANPDSNSYIDGLRSPHVSALFTESSSVSSLTESAIPIGPGVHNAPQPSQGLSENVLPPLDFSPSFPPL
ncbi:hypothetical protein DL93DRAFT_2234399 [Clavulina sp. PMI_390]|nr:hypothetical protein DL93DRAFT_2234399 [Clavulina sp. PMI_390]